MKSPISLLVLNWQLSSFKKEETALFLWYHTQYSFLLEFSVQDVWFTGNKQRASLFDLEVPCSHFLKILFVFASFWHVRLQFSGTHSYLRIVWLCVSFHDTMKTIHFSYVYTGHLIKSKSQSCSLVSAAITEVSWYQMKLCGSTHVRCSLISKHFI